MSICQSFFFFNWPTLSPSRIGVALAALARLPCRGGAVVTFKISREIAVDAHWHPPRFPSDFHRHIEHQQAVDAGLVLRQRIWSSLGGDHRPGSGC